jgi:hypothetical protein
VGPTGPGAAATIYACLYNTDNVTLTTSSTATGALVAFTNTSPSAGAGYSNNTIVANLASSIRITAVLLVSNAQSDSKYHLSVQKNGVQFIDGIQPEMTVYGGGLKNGGALTLDVITTCNPNDNFGLYFYDDGFSGNFTLGYSSLTITSLGGTQGVTGPQGAFSGNVPTGSTINGAQVLKANLGPTGPWSSVGFLNSQATGTILAARNAGNSYDI